MTAKPTLHAKHTEDQFRLLVETVIDYAIFLLDADGRVETWNAGAERIKGYRAEEVVGRHFSLFYPSEDVKQGKPAAVLGEAVATGRAEDEGWRVRKDGSRFWGSVVITALHDADGRLIGFAKVTRDVTERRELLERLQQLQSITEAGLAHLHVDKLLSELLTRIRQILASDTAAILLLDMERQDLIVHAAVGLEEEAARGHRVPLGHGFAGRVAAERRAIAIDDVDDVDIVSPVLREKRICSVLGAPLIVEGQVLGVVHVGTLDPRRFSAAEADLLQMVADRAAVAIERARLYEAERSARAELEVRVAARTAELLEVNGELEAFAYSVAHDLRAPLRSLHGLTQALVEDYGDRLDDTGRDYARTVVESAVQMERLIEDLLEYSRLSRADLPRDRVEFRDVVDRVLARLAPLIAVRSASVSVDGPLPAVTGHVGTLEQVITNLVTNAVTFVAAERRPMVRVHGDEDDTVVRVTVEDNGIGIAPEHQERVFKIFERLHGVERYPGTGVGLALVRRGIERLGGRVGVESEVGRGSRFWVELPKAGVTCR